MKEWLITTNETRTNSLSGTKENVIIKQFAERIQVVDGMVAFFNGKECLCVYNDFKNIIQTGGNSLSEYYLTKKGS